MQKTLAYYLLAPIITYSGTNCLVDPDLKSIWIESTYPLNHLKNFVKKESNWYQFQLTEDQIEYILKPFLESKYSRMDKQYLTGLVDWLYKNQQMTRNTHKFAALRTEEAIVNIEEEYGVHINRDEEIELLPLINEEEFYV